MTLEKIYEEFTIGSDGFCLAIEKHCLFAIDREQIARIATKAKTADEFAIVYQCEDWWVSGDAR